MRIGTGRSVGTRKFVLCHLGRQRCRDETACRKCIATKRTDCGQACEEIQKEEQTEKPRAKKRKKATDLGCEICLKEDHTDKVEFQLLLMRSEPRIPLSRSLSRSGANGVH